jgi:hypothetical protein
MIKLLESAGICGSHLSAISGSNEGHKVCQFKRNATTDT